MITDEQRKARLNGLGASDSAIIMGFSTYKTPYELYLEKTGVVEASDEESEQQYWGNMLEQSILDHFARENKVTLEYPDTIYHPKYPFIFANLDAWCPELNAVVEAKNSNSFMAKTWDRVQEDGIPMQYLIQIAKQVAIADCEEGYCAVLIGGNEYRQYTYRRDMELEDMIVQADIAFWDCVQMRIEPELTQVSDYKIKYPESEAFKAVMPEFLLPVIEEMQEIRAQAKKWEKQMDKLKMEVMKFMRTANALVDEKGRTLATWNQTKRGRTFLLK